MAVGERMKYFMIVQSENNPFPEIVNWNRALDVRAMNREAYRSLPPFLMLDMRLDLDAYMPDILVSPFLLLSREAMEMVVLYEQELPFVFAALFDTKQGICGSYYCPIPEDVACVVERRGNGDIQILLKQEQIGGKVLFRGDVRDKKRIVIRMDLAESLLARDITGLELREVTVL